MTAPHRLAPRLLAASVGLLLVAWCLREDVQPDLYFHLAAGRWILANGLPDTNVFLAFFPEHAFIDHEWLFQVVCWPLFQVGGAAALTFCKCMAVLATFALLAAGCRRSPLARWFVLIAALTVAGGRFILRPEVFSFLGVAAHVVLLTPRTGRDLDKRVLIALPLLQLLWSNTHGFSLLGPVLVVTTLGAALAHALIARLGRAGPLGTPPSRTTLVRLLALLGLEVMASISNPYGLEVALYPFFVLSRASQDTASAGLSYRVVELASPFTPALRSIPEIRVYLTWLILAPPLYAVAVWRGRARLEHGALGLVLTLTSVLYLRNLPFAAIGLALPTAAGLSALGDLLRERFGPRPRLRLAMCAAGILLVLGLTRAVLDDRFHTNASYDARAGIGLGSFPTYPEAVAFLEQSPPEGGLFNNFGAGHYLLYARPSAEPKPAICGNTDLYPRAWLARYHLIMRGELDLDAELSELGISDLLLDHRVEVDGVMLRALLANPRWGLVHAGPHALIFRRGAEGLDVDALATRIETEWAYPDEASDRFGPTAALRALRLLPAKRRIHPLRRLGSARLLELLGERERALAQAAAANELAPGSALVLRTLADLEHYHGDPEEAASRWRQLAERTPEPCLPLVKLGLLALRRGKGGAREARDWFLAALERDPASQLARENLLTAYEMDEDPVELRRALALTPELRSAKRHYYLGSAALMEDDLERAEAELTASLDADPGLAPAQALLAQALGRLGKLEPAELAWTRLCFLVPEDASAWRALGDLRRVRGRLPQALTAYHRADELDPAEYRAALSAAEMLLEREQPEAALEWIRKVLARSPKHKGALKLYRRVTSTSDD